LGLMCAQLSILAVCCSLQCQDDTCLLYTASLQLSHLYGLFCIGHVKTLDI